MDSLMTMMQQVLAIVLQYSDQVVHDVEDVVVLIRWPLVSTTVHTMYMMIIMVVLCMRDLRIGT